MRRRALVLASWLVLAPGGPGGSRARAGEEPAAERSAASEVEAWIRDLASDAFEVREAARKGLERRGREAPDVLQKHADDADAEVRRTVRALLERLGAVLPVPPAEAANLARVGRVRLHAADRPLGEVLKELGDGLGGSFALDAGEAQKRVRVDVEDAPYFEALEALVAAAGLRAPGAFDGEGRLTLVPGVAGRASAPSAAAGPVRLRVARVAAARSLDGAERRTHTLTLEVHLAPCVQLVSYRAPRVEKAEDAAGRPWRVAGGLAPATTYGVGGDVRRVEANVALEPPEGGGEERLARLDLVLPLRLRHERRAVRFEPLSGLPRTVDERGKPAEAGAKGSVTLLSVTRAEERKDAWIVDLSAVLASPTGRESADAFLLTADGAKRHVWIAGGRSTTSADGRLHLVGRCFGTGEAAPTALDVTWFDREGEGELSLHLTDVPLR